MSAPPLVHTDDRFLRRTRNEQVRKSRRNRSLLRAATWIGLHVAVAGVVAFAAWAGHRYLTGSERFAVRRVLLSGGRSAPEREIRKITDRYVGRNLFTADLAALQSGLESQPWIRSAHAKRRVPDTLLIAIEERTPGVLVRVGSSLYLADTDGTLLDRFGPEYADHDFPILTGLDRAGRETLRRRVRLGASFVAALYRGIPSLADSVSEVDLARDDALVVRLNDGSPPLLVSPDALTLNLDNYLALRNYIAANYSDVEYVDLRWKDRITIRPAGGRKTENAAQQ
jgi:cell division septal protein FtsQ